MPEIKQTESTQLQTTPPSVPKMAARTKEPTPVETLMEAVAEGTLDLSNIPVLQEDQKILVYSPEYNCNVLISGQQIADAMVRAGVKASAASFRARANANAARHLRKR